MLQYNNRLNASVDVTTVKNGTASGIWSMRELRLQLLNTSWPKAVTTPLQPTNIVAYNAIMSASISFTAPTDNGGAPITNYTVVSSGGQTATGISSPIVINGLTNGTSYTFNVYATNIAGNGTASSSSNAVVPSDNGQTTFATPGTYSWIVPVGVGSVSVVAVGGGGGGNATGGGDGTNTLAGGDSSFGTSAIAGGGRGGINNNSAGGTTAGGTVKAGSGTNGGTDASKNDGHNGSGNWGASGGGGAGLLNGGTAPVGWSNDWNAQGGSGASITSSGVGATGLVATVGEVGGAGGLYGGGGGAGRDGLGGGGGAIAYANNIAVTAGQSITVVVGSGGITWGVPRSGGSGGSGAVRIIWGVGRSFPSTNIGDL